MKIFEKVRKKNSIDSSVTKVEQLYKILILFRLIMISKIVLIFLFDVFELFYNTTDVQNLFPYDILLLIISLRYNHL